MTNITYRLEVIGRNEYGESASTPEMARLLLGHLQRKPGERLVVQEASWKEQDGQLVIDRKVAIEMESRPGEWGIGEFRISQSNAKLLQCGLMHDGNHTLVVKSSNKFAECQGCGTFFSAEEVLAPELAGTDLRRT